MFNNNLGCFDMWISSFSGVVIEIGVKPSEEMDLLIK